VFAIRTVAPIKNSFVKLSLTYPDKMCFCAFDVTVEIIKNIAKCHLNFVAIILKIKYDTKVQMCFQQNIDK
jgi:hypothetical protein